MVAAICRNAMTLEPTESDAKNPLHSQIFCEIEQKSHTNNGTNAITHGTRCADVICIFKANKTTNRQ